MKKITNHTRGPKGVNLKNGSTLWIEPGDTAEIDPDTVIGKVTDFGKKPDASPTDGTGLQAQIDVLTKQVETLTAERDDLSKDKADLTKQVETLTKPADKK